MSGLFDWFVDSMASEDVIDLYFILSDLVDIDLTEAELSETAHFDAMASQSVGVQNGEDGNVPLGKLVL